MITFSNLKSKLLSERVLSIGLNPDHEIHRTAYKEKIHNILRDSYKVVGGYAGHEHGSKSESDAIYNDILNPNHIIKLTKRNNNVSAVSLYKKQYGRKLIAIGTDGTEQGKKDFYKNHTEDSKLKRSWGEYSGPAEKISRKVNMPEIPNNRVKELIGKLDINLDPHSNRYTRKIGSTFRDKIMLGYPNGGN